MSSPKYKFGDVLIYQGYYFDKPVEFELTVAEIPEDRPGEYIYYSADDDDCYESEVIRVKE